MSYLRPLVQHGASRPKGALPLAGGAQWFTHLERLSRDGAPEVIRVAEADEATRIRLSRPRAPVLGLDLSQPRIMGIVNVTPDSFSDGGVNAEPQDAVSAARAMMRDGVDMLDIGGESTRPGAATVLEAEEIGRIVPVFESLSGEGFPISVDTRKAAVAQAAVAAGAGLVNDVSALTFDAGMAGFVADNALPVCIMHAQGDPATMQANPRYENVLLDVYDFLSARLDALEAQGIARDRVLIDPGIGFGKTLEHNLALLRGLSLFHSLGCALLLGVSRKRFIGTLSDEPEPARRFPGSVAAGLAALAQGVQILRVHDVRETVQALRLWQAVREP